MNTEISDEWITDGLSEVEELAIGARWTTFALAKALIEAGTVERNAVVNAVDEVIAHVREGKPDLEIKALQEFRDTLIQMGD